VNPSTSFRLTEEARAIIVALSKFFGCSKTQLIERLLRRKFDEVRDILPRER